ncbi:MAG: ferric reductase-like transmembrane domain-containing protein [Pseudomonadota bacterium]
MRLVRASLIWAALLCAVAIPIAAASLSPYLEWRQPIYIVAGFAGIAAMGLLLIQPVLMAGVLPGLTPLTERRVHRWVGLTLVAAVALHVVALWITSPPDVVDALLFVSPTPFSLWGVIAMWAVFAAALLAFLRRRLRLKPRLWRVGHLSLAVVIVAGSVAHALLIEGTMEIMSKVALCALVILATAKVIGDRLGWTRRLPRPQHASGGNPP